MSHEMKSPRATFADWQNWPGPDTRIVELLDGEIVVSPAPSPWHAIVVGRIVAAIRSVRPHMSDFGSVLSAPVGVVLSEDCVLEPDVLYFRRANVGQITKTRVSGPPDLVMEVLSPSNRRHDTIRKRGLYAQFGVPEYWIVDPDAKTIEILRLDGESYVVTRFEGEAVATSPFALPGFSIALERLFDDDMTKE